MRCPRCQEEAPAEAVFCPECGAKLSAVCAIALFGAPLAHEDHAVRACYAALRMQDAVKRYAAEVQRTQAVSIYIRVGVNSGEGEILAATGQLEEAVRAHQASIVRAAELGTPREAWMRRAALGRHLPGDEGGHRSSAG